MGKRLFLIPAWISLGILNAINVLPSYAQPVANGLILPHQCDTDQLSFPFVYRITNLIGTDDIKLVQINVPSGFTYDALGGISPPSGKSWSGSFSGGFVVLDPDGPGDYLIQGDSVSVTIYVNTDPTPQGPTTWIAIITGDSGFPNGATEATAGDMKVEIVSLSAEAGVSPNIVDDGQSSAAITVISTNTGVDKLKEVKITIPSSFTYVSIGPISASGGKNWSSSEVSGVVTLTPDTDPNDWLDNGEYVQADINVNTQSGSLPPALWPIEVKGGYDGITSATEAVSGGMKVQIMSLSSTGTILPHSVYASSDVSLTYRIVNTGEDKIKSLEINIPPSGFSFVSTGTLSASRSWNAWHLSGVVYLEADTPGDYLLNGEFAEIEIEVITDPTTKPPAYWQGTITGEYNGTKTVAEAASGDLEVEIVTLSGNALVLPHQVYNDSDVNMSYQLTNNGDDKLKKVEIDLPGGFTYISTGPVSASAGKEWTSEYTGGKVVLVASQTADSLSYGQSLQTTIDVHTQLLAQGATTWPSIITGDHDGTSDASEAASGDMQVEIVDISANSLVAPHIVGANEPSIPITHRTTNKGSDKLKNVEITIPAGFTFVSTEPVTTSGGEVWSSSESAGTVFLYPATSDDYIPKDGWAETVINVQTGGSQVAVTWNTSIAGENGKAAFSSAEASGDMDVEIVSILASGIITPHIVNGGQYGSTFTCRITNRDGEEIKVATITFPSGFTYAGVSSITASAGKSWGTSYGSGELRLYAVYPSSRIINDEWVEVEFQADTQIDFQDYVLWVTTVAGDGGGISAVDESSPLDMQVRIESLLANGKVEPHAVDGDQDMHPATYTITNIGTDSLTKAEIFIADGFTFVSTGNVYASGRSWSASGSGSTVTLTADGPGEYLQNTEYVETVIYVRTQADSQGFVTWGSSATGFYGGMAGCSTETAGGMDIEIKSLKANGVITPHEVDGGQTSQSLSYYITNEGGDEIKSLQIIIPNGFTYNSVASVNASPGKIWDYSYSPSTLTIFAVEISSSIANGEFVEVSLVVGTQYAATPPAKWQGIIEGALNGKNYVDESAAGDLDAEIFSLGANGLLAPRSVNTSQNNQLFNYQFTSTGTDQIKTVYFTIPDGFTYAGVSTVTASGGQTWDFSYSGALKRLTLSANPPSESISNGESLQVSLTCQTQITSLPLTTWPANAIGVYNGIVTVTEASPQDMQSGIVILEANGLVAPDPVGDDRNYDMTYQVTNAGGDSIKEIEIYVPVEFINVQFDTVTASGGQDWSGSASGSTVTLNAVTGSDWIPGGQSVQAVIKVETALGDQPPVTWNALVTGGYDGTIQATELTGGDMDVDINTIYADGLVTPHEVNGGQSSQAITYRITNTGTDELKRVIIIVPSGFTFFPPFGPITASLSKTWNGSFTGLVILDAAGPGDYIENGEFVQVVMYVQTQAGALPPTQWFSLVTGESNENVSVAEQTSGDMEVEIIPLSAQALVAPDTVNGGQSNIPLTYHVTNTNTDSIKKVEIPIPSGFTFSSIGSTSASPGRNWNSGFAGSTVTLDAIGPGDYILNGEFVEVIINVNTLPSPPSPVTWHSRVTGNYDGVAQSTEAVSGDMDVEVLPISASALTTPQNAYTNSSPTIVYRSTNTGADSIKGVEIYVPSGFDFVSMGTISAFSGGAKNWSCPSVDDGGMSGSTVTCTADVLPNDYISTGGFVEVEINVNTQASPQPPATWQSQVTGEYDGTAQSTGNMDVEILSIVANSTATPHQVYTSGLPAISYRTTNAGTDRIKEVEIYIPPGFDFSYWGGVSASGGKDWDCPTCISVDDGGWSGSTVTLSADGGGNYIDPGGWVQRTLVVNTPASPQPAVPWHSQVKGEYDGIAQSTEAVPGNGDMDVEILSVSADAKATPHHVYTSSSPKMVYRSTNTGTDRIRTVEIYVPSGFDFVSMGTISAFSGGVKNWSCTFVDGGMSGSTVTCTADVLPGDYISTDGFVEAEINVNTQASAQSEVKWRSRVTGEYSGTAQSIEAISGDMDVEILSISANASATPHLVYASASPTIVYRSTNTGTDEIKEAEIYVPPGFDFVSTGTISAFSAGVKNWSCPSVDDGGMSGSTVTLTADGPGDYISADGFVEVAINVNTQVSPQPAVEWESRVTGEYDGTAQSTVAVSGDMDVEIVSLAATALISSPHSLLIDRISAVTYRVTNAGTDKIKKATITIPSGFTYITHTDPSGWPGLYASGKLTLTADTEGDYIDTGQYVQTNVTVLTQGSALPPTTWYCDVTGAIDGVAQSTEVAPGDMLIELVALGAYAEILPPKVDTGQDDFPLVYIVTNTGISEILSSTITIPPGFDPGSLVVTTVTATGNKSWNYVVNGSSLNILAGTSDDYIYKDEYVRVEFTCDIQETPIPSTTWDCAIGDETGVVRKAEERIVGDTKSEIVLLSAIGNVTPSVVPKNSIDWEVTYYVQNTGDDSLTQIEILIPSTFTFKPSGGISVTAWGTKIWNGSESGGVITLSTFTAADKLETGHDVEAVFYIDTPDHTVLPSSWTSVAKGSLGGLVSVSTMSPGSFDMETVALYSTGTITPHKVYNNRSNQALKYLISNLSTDRLKKVEITIPPGFTDVTLGTIDAGGKSWSGGFSGNTITLDASGAAHYLSLGEQIECNFDVTTQLAAQVAEIFPLRVTGESTAILDCSEASPGDMKVEIVDLRADASAGPSQVYAGQTVPITYTITSKGTDFIKRAEIYISSGFTYSSHEPFPIANGGKNWQADYTAPSTVTLTAQTTSDYISSGESLTTEITVNTQILAQDPTTWMSVVFGETGDSKQTGDETPGSRDVEIMTISAYALVTPRQLDSGQDNQSVIIEITNNATEKIEEVRINIPGGFTYKTNETPEASDSKIWNRTGINPLLIFTANTPNDYLDAGQYFRVRIGVITQPSYQAPTAFDVTAVGANAGTFDVPDGNLKVEIIRMRATASASPPQVYSNESGQTVNYDITHESSTSKMKQAEICVPPGFEFVSVSSITASGKSWDYEFSGGTVTVQAATNADWLDVGETLSLKFLVNTGTTQAPVDWTSQVTSTREAVVSSEGTRQVEIIDLKASGEISPRIVNTGRLNLPLTFIITNLELDQLKSFRLTIPNHFSFVSFGAVVSSNSKVWTGSQAGDTLVFEAQSSGDYLDQGEWVQATIRVNTVEESEAPVSWQADVTGALGKTREIIEETPGDMEIEILPLESSASVSPRNFDADETGKEITYTVVNTGRDRIRKIDLFIPAYFAYQTFVSTEPPGTKEWDYAQTGNRLILSASDYASALDEGESLVAKFTVDVGTLPAKGILWNSVITGISSGTALSKPSFPGGLTASIRGYLIEVSTATPTVVVPGGEATVKVKLVSSTGTVQAGKDISFNVSSGNGQILGGSVDATDAEGFASKKVRASDSGIITVELHFEKHTSSTCKIEIVTQAPDFSALFSVQNGDAMVIKAGISQISFHMIDGLDIEYLVNKGFSSSKPGMGTLGAFKTLQSGSWETYTGPFSISETGPHTLYYRYVDASGTAGPIFSTSLYVSQVNDKPFINYPNPFAAGREDTTFEYTLPEDSEVTLEIFDLFGQKVFEKEFIPGENPGGIADTNLVPWDGKNNQGRTVANGGYIARLTVKNSQGTNVFKRKVAVAK